MGLIRLRAELSALRDAINQLRSTIQEHSEAIHFAQERRHKNQAEPERLPVLVSYDEQINTDQNRQYRTQKKIANWTKGAVIAASIYASIAAYQAYVAHSTLNAMISQQRPWVSVESISLDKGPYFYRAQEGYGVSLDFSAVLKNYGTTPARREFEIFKPMVALHAPPDWRQPSFCDEADGLFKDDENREHEPVIFPNNTIVRKGEGSSILAGGQHTGMSWIFIEGCIVYEGPSNDIYHIRFVFRSIRASRDPDVTVPAPNFPGLRYAPISGFSLFDIRAD